MMNVTSLSVILRAAAVVVFILATLGVAPVPMTPLGLALWCGSTVRKLPHPVDSSKVDFPGPRRCPCESPGSPRARSSAS